MKGIAIDVQDLLLTPALASKEPHSLFVWNEDYFLLGHTLRLTFFVIYSPSTVLWACGHSALESRDNIFMRNETRNETHYFLPMNAHPMLCLRNCHLSVKSDRRIVDAHRPYFCFKDKITQSFFSGNNCCDLMLKLSFISTSTRW